MLPPADAGLQERNRVASPENRSKACNTEVLELPLHSTALAVLLNGAHALMRHSMGSHAGAHRDIAVCGLVRSGGGVCHAAAAPPPPLSAAIQEEQRAAPDARAC